MHTLFYKIVLLLILSGTVIEESLAESADTIYIRFNENYVSCDSHMNGVTPTIDKGHLLLNVKDVSDVVLTVSGKSHDGSLTVNSNRHFTLKLDGVQLTSGSRPVFRSVGKKSVTVQLSDGRNNYFGDNSRLYPKDSLHLSRFCMSCVGSVDFSGNGTLNIESKSNNGIGSKKNISFHSGTLSVLVGKQDGCCLQASDNIDINGGNLNLITTGIGHIDAIKYDSCKYSTAKCIFSHGNIYIRAGKIKCLSKGNGGKGVFCKGELRIGERNMNTLDLSVETQGDCLDNKEDIDQRDGSPKAISTRGNCIIDGGHILCKTRCVGGEGFESKKTLVINDGMIECYTYDDGINTGEKFEMNGGQLFCCSTANDGIDSNGFIYVNGGVIASISCDKWNEALDAEKGQLYLKGGTVFGVGNDHMKVANSILPIYNTEGDIIDGQEEAKSSLALEADRWIHLVCDNKIIMSLYNANNITESAFMLIQSDRLQIDKSYMAVEGEKAEDAQSWKINDCLTFGGKLSANYRTVATFTPRIYNDIISEQIEQ